MSDLPSHPDAGHPEAAPKKQRTAAQRRIVEVALALFAEHGINGTSLQMMADALGVTKAAVYHQFRTKDEIIVAAMEEPMRRFGSALEAAEAERWPGPALEALVAEVVDLAVKYRAILSNLQGDPGMAFLSSYEPYQMLMRRLQRVMGGGDRSPRARVRTAMVSAALSRAAVHPIVADLDDRSLRRYMTSLATEFLDLPTGARAGLHNQSAKKESG